MSNDVKELKQDRDKTIVRTSVIGIGANLALAARYGVSAGTITDCVIKTSTKDATGLTNRFLSDENARRTMTNDSLTQVGIAVVERDGMDFVAEIFAG